MPDRNRWNYTPEEQKDELVVALERYLQEHSGDLTDRQKLLIRDAINHTFRGLYGMAIQDIYDLALEEKAWASPVPAALVEGITRQMLQRALQALKYAPAQTRPVFG